MTVSVITLIVWHLSITCFVIGFVERVAKSRVFLPCSSSHVTLVDGLVGWKFDFSVWNLETDHNFKDLSFATIEQTFIRVLVLRLFRIDFGKFYVETKHCFVKTVSKWEFCPFKDFTTSLILSHLNCIVTCCLSFWRLL